MERFIAIDVETASPEHICQVGLVVFEDGTPVEKWETLVNPECEFSKQNIKIHGITPEKVRDAPTFPSIYRQLYTLLDGQTAVAYGRTDENTIDAMCRIYQSKEPHPHWIDLCCIARRVIPMPTYALTAMAKRFGIPHTPHNALSDAMVAGNLAMILANTADCSVGNLKKEDLAIKEWTPRPYQITREYAMCFEDKVVVFTGTFVWEKREYLEWYASLLGAKVTKSISKKTSFVVVGVEPGTAKMQKVSELGTKVLSEEEFLDMIGLVFRNLTQSRKW